MRILLSLSFSNAPPQIWNVLKIYLCKIQIIAMLILEVYP